MAVEKKLISIDDKVEVFLPELAGNKAGSITLRQLSTHTSGIQRSPKKLSDAGPLLPYEDYNRSQLIHEVLNASYKNIEDLEVYSNLGIALLSYSLEKIFNQDFEQAMYDHVLNPLGLQDIYVTINEDQESIMSKKYLQSLDEVPIWRNLGIFNGVGSFKATTSLMLDYVYAQLNPEKTNISEAIKRSQKALHKFSKESIGYAWYLLKKPVGQLLRHNGSTIGFSSDVYIAPERNKGIVILSNTDTKVECVNAIFFFNKECKPKELQIDPEDVLLDYQSFYQVNGFNFGITITKKEDNVLTLYFADQDYGVRLFKTSNDKYEFFGGIGSVAFQRDGAGIVTSLKFSQKTANGTVKYTADKL